MISGEYRNVITFDAEPTVAQLWDVCVRQLLYPADAYVDELCSWLQANGITKASRIVDVAAGGGFPMLELAQRGYQQLTCLDASLDQHVVFRKNAKVRGISLVCEEYRWLEIPLTHRQGQYDALFCRGNSFIYAAGGWNIIQAVEKDASFTAYRDTLKIFHEMLAPDGALYIDKFFDDEVSGERHVADTRIAGVPHELSFMTSIDQHANVRRAAQVLRDERGNSRGVPNVAYNLTMPELRDLLNEVGFSHIAQPHFKTETHFDIITARR